MSAEAPPESVLEPEPDLLDFGPVGPSRSVRRGLALLVGVVLLVLGVFGVVRLLPRPLPDLSLADLQSVYGGMVSADGTNEVSVVHRGQVSEKPERVVPASCSPLFDFTLSDQFPTNAIDGVSTFWLDQGQASISLLTYRYPDKQTAKADYQAVSTALDSCVDHDVQISRHAPVTVTRQPIPPPGRVGGSLSYLVSSGPDEGRFSIDLALLNNTVTWQYRYNYQRSGSYTTLPAQQLMSALFSQLEVVQDSHR
jgi:hypothetical protein